jgi:hypothetical protein
MKIEFKIIIVMALLVSATLFLIYQNPDETPKSTSFEKHSSELVEINELSKKYQSMENQQSFENSKNQMKEKLKEITFDYTGLKISDVELIEGYYPFQNTTHWEKRFDLEPLSVCDFEEKIPLHMKIISRTENYEKFTKKYSRYDITLSIMDERNIPSNIHYGLIATNTKNQMASTYFHLDSCTEKITDKKTLFLNCHDEETGYRYATLNYDDIVSSYSNEHFCKIELDPWRQSVYDYSQILNEERRASDIKQMSGVVDQESQERAFSEMHKQGELGNIVGNIVHGEFDEQKTQDMIKEYEKQYDRLPEELLELIEKRE